MSLKNIYFVANWKMHGSINSSHLVKKIRNFSNKNAKSGKSKIILCVPYLFISLFKNILKNSSIKLGAQNVSNVSEDYGAYTGSISPRMLKDTGIKYIILGHSELREKGENNNSIKEKISNSVKSNLNIILCVGESYSTYKTKKSIQFIKSQLQVLTKKTIKNTIIAYEPIWSIGTGKIPSEEYLNKTFDYLTQYCKKKYSLKPKILYGGSVNENNIKILKNIYNCSGFLIGGASLKYKSFTNLIKNYYK
mgnify:CR=1 FL=1